MPAYEAGPFVPAAPVARAIVRGPTGSVRTDVPLLIDTGADISAIPRSVAQSVAALVRPSDVVVRFYDGSEILCELAELSVEFLRFRFSGMFVIADADHGVLGRNVLNRLVVTLDGPRLTWE